MKKFSQCGGSVTFWYESGSADPYHCLTDTGFIRQWLTTKNMFFFTKLFCLLLFQGKYLLLIYQETEESFYVHGRKQGLRDLNKKQNKEIYSHYHYVV
jgi:hypothetical protein